MKNLSPFLVQFFNIYLYRNIYLYSIHLNLLRTKNKKFQNILTTIKKHFNVYIVVSICFWDISLSSRASQRAFLQIYAQKAYRRNDILLSKMILTLNLCCVFQCNAATKKSTSKPFLLFNFVHERNVKVLKYYVKRHVSVQKYLLRNTTQPVGAVVCGAHAQNLEA